MAARPSRRSIPSRPVRQAASWLALLATTTLGAESSTLLAEVQLEPRARAPHQQCPQRLIVQVYPGAQSLSDNDSKPTSSAQRAVTVQELRKGVAVHLVNAFPDAINLPDEQLTVVAWVEPGEPDLELDALHARPTPHLPLAKATVRPDADCVKLRLGGPRRA